MNAIMLNPVPERPRRDAAAPVPAAEEPAPETPRRRRWYKNKWTWIAATVLSAAVLTGVIRKAAAPKPPEAQIGAVKRGDLISRVAAPGKVKAVSEVKISAYVMGPITRLPVAEGKRVKKGQLLAQIDPTPFRAQAAQAEAALTMAQSASTQSSLVWERKSQLFRENLISREEMDAAATQYRSDKARVAQAEAALAQARDQLAKTSLTSPIDGTVSQLNVDVGEVVVTGTMNNPGSVLMLVSDLGVMKMEAEVDESDVRDLSLGQTSTIEVEAMPDKIYQGIVTEIGNAPVAKITSAENTTVAYPVSIRIQGDKAGLKPGMTANVEIATAKVTHALLVPIQALATRPVDGKSRDVVFLYSDQGTAGKVRAAAVTGGISDVENIELKDGIREGDRIVIGPFDLLRKLKDGDAVRPAGAAKNPAGAP